MERWRKARIWLAVMAVAGFYQFQGVDGASATVAAWGSNTWGQTAVPPGLTNVTAIAGGQYFSLAVKTDGRVVAWGYTNYGTEFPPSNLTNVTAVAAGATHAIALKKDGTVVAWGSGTSGQTNSPPLSGVAAIAAGQYHNIALLSNGTVYCWGDNAFGKTTPPPELYNTPVTSIAAGANHSLAVFWYNGRGHVAGWGQNSYGQISIPPDLQMNGTADVRAVAAGDNHSLALLANGTVVAWGHNYYYQGTSPQGINDAVAIAAGGNFSMLLRANGTIYAWGANANGEATPPSNLTNVISIAAGGQHGLALYYEPITVVSQPQAQTVIAGNPFSFGVTNRGSLPYFYQWQKNNTNIAGATNAIYAVALASSNDMAYYRVIISNPVSVVTTSNVLLTVLVPPSILAHPTNQEVALNGSVVFYVTATGTAPLSYQWRKNGTNIPGANLSSYAINNASTNDAGVYSVIVSNSAGVAISSNATLVVNLPPVILVQPQSQTVPSGGSVTFSVVASNAVSYQWQKDGNNIMGATGSVFTINSATTNDSGIYRVRVSNAGGTTVSDAASLTVTPPPDGTNFFVLTWGETLYFNGTIYIDYTAPAGLSGVSALAVGGYHTLALRTDGTVTGWGDNSYGQASAPGLSGVKAIAAGLHHSLALHSNGTVTAWGRNQYGQVNVPAGLTNIMAIACGANHCLALRSNGTVAAWGDNTDLQAAPPPLATNIIAVAAGLKHSLGLRANGTVVGWGDNSQSQRSVPVNLSNVVAIAAGNYHSLALLKNGTVVGWGADLYDYGQARPPAGLTNVVAIAAGANHSLALLKNNVVVAWGQNNFGQSVVPAGLSGVYAIGAGPTRSVAARLNPLKWGTPQKIGGGQWQITLGNADSTAFGSERVAKIEVYATTNLVLPLTNWTRLSNEVTYGAGKLWVTDTNAGGRRWRGFFSIERP